MRPGIHIEDDAGGNTGRSSGDDAEPSSRRPRHAIAALCALACLAAIGCAGTTKTTSTDRPAKSTEIAVAEPEAAAPAPTPAPVPAPAPAPAPRPAPLVKPIETFEALWTTVRDQHFDPSLNGVDWNAVHAEFLPRVQAAASQDELRDLLSSMLARLGQSHFVLIPRGSAAQSPAVETPEEAVADAKDGASERASTAASAAASTASSTGDDAAPSGPSSPGIAGLDIALVEDVPTVIRVTPGLAAARAGVLVGWELVSVDGEMVAETLDPLRESMAREHDAGSPHARQLRSHLASGGAELLRGGAGAARSVVFRDASGGERRIAIVLEKSPLGSTRFGNLPAFPIEVESRIVELPVENGPPIRIGYLSFNIWMTGAGEAIDKGIDSMRGCDGVVIDLRGNPGGVGALAMSLAGHFLNESASLGSLIARTNTLSFNVTPRKISAAGKRVRPISKPLAVILDARSASTSEVFAGGLQDLGRARIFGETSAGMALPARAIELPSGDVLLHAIADFTTSKGTRLEGRGVIPDDPVSLGRAELLTGKDAMFDRAADWIRATTLASRAPKPTADATRRPTPRERAAARAAAAAAVTPPIAPAAGR